MDWKLKWNNCHNLRRKRWSWEEQLLFSWSILDYPYCGSYRGPDGILPCLLIPENHNTPCSILNSVKSTWDALPCAEQPAWNALLCSMLNAWRKAPTGVYKITFCGRSFFPTKNSSNFRKKTPPLSIFYKKKLPIPAYLYWVYKKVRFLEMIETPGPKKRKKSWNAAPPHLWLKSGHSKRPTTVF